MLKQLFKPTFQHIYASFVATLVLLITNDKEFKKLFQMIAEELHIKHQF